MTSSYSAVRAGSGFLRKRAPSSLHVSTKKHIDNKKERSKESCKQISVMASLAQRDKLERPVGETLPLEHRAHRVDVVENFLREGIPLRKIDGMRPLLEKKTLACALAPI